RDSIDSLSEIRLEGRRLVLDRSVVNHHSVNYDRLTEILAAENLSISPPPSHMSMLGTSVVSLDPFAKRVMICRQHVGSVHQGHPRTYSDLV
ncbi:hypothetical protein PHYSODRAFT_488577, partial [Phytophthora sojae]